MTVARRWFVRMSGNAGGLEMVAGGPRWATRVEASDHRPVRLALAGQDHRLGRRSWPVPSFDNASLAQTGRLLLFTLTWFRRLRTPAGGQQRTYRLRQLVAALLAMVAHRRHESETLNDPPCTARYSLSTAR